MAQTIGKHAGKSHEGDFIATCAYCGVAWYRSRLERNAAGQLICPDHQHIRDPVTLSRLNARRTSRLISRKVDGGIADTEAKTTSGPLAIVAATVVAGWEASRANVTIQGFGVAVRAWTPIVGSGGFTLEQSGVELRPTLKEDGPSGRAYVSFGGSHELRDEGATPFLRPAPIDAPTFYWAVVRQARAPAGTAGWWAFQSATGITLAGAALSGAFAQIASGAANFVTPPINRFQRIEVSFTGSVADYVKIGPTTAAGGSAGSSAPNGKFHMGAVENAGFDPAAFSYLDVCEFWILSAAPSASARDKLDDYARAKYGSDVLL